MRITAPLSRLVQDFFRVHLVARRNLSPHTVRAYRDALRALLRFAAQRASREVARLELDHLGRDVVLAFLDHLETIRGNCPRTRNARLAAIHSFFRFVAAEEPSCVDVCRRVLGVPYKRHRQATVICLDRHEVEHLLASVPRTTTPGRRDAALLLFLYNTGARAQEVVDLLLPALRLQAPAQVRLLGKGRKERLCPLWRDTVAYLRDTTRDRGVREDANVPLFVNAAGHPLTRFGLRYIVQTRVAEAARTRPSLATKRVTPHTFRHTTALHLLQAGVELNVVRSWLGHASIATTHEYVEINIEMKRRALAACAVLGGKGRRASWPKPDLLQWLDSL